MSAPASQRPHGLYMAGAEWDLAQAVDLTLPVDPALTQARCFGLPGPSFAPLLRSAAPSQPTHGWGCNVDQLTLAPHLHGTHTEGLGHLVAEHMPLAVPPTGLLVLAVLITAIPGRGLPPNEGYTPTPNPEDLTLAQPTLQASWEALAHEGGSPPAPPQALVLRTRPNPPAKQTRDHHTHPAPYFTHQAMQWLAQLPIQHLVVDLPSLDREADDAHLSNHRLWWGLPPTGQPLAAQAKHPHRTVTELVYVPDLLPDGPYLMHLGLPALLTDAVPSRVVLIPPMGRRLAASRPQPA